MEADSSTTVLPAHRGGSRLIGAGYKSATLQDPRLEGLGSPQRVGPNGIRFSMYTSASPVRNMKSSQARDRSAFVSANPQDQPTAMQLMDNAQVYRDRSREWNRPMQVATTMESRSKSQSIGQRRGSLMDQNFTRVESPLFKVAGRGPIPPYRRTSTPQQKTKPFTPAMQQGRATTAVSAQQTDNSLKRPLIPKPSQIPRQMPVRANSDMAVKPPTTSAGSMQPVPSADPADRPSPQGLRRKTTDAEIIIDEEDEEQEAGYGMTLSAYMSKMQTTPACPLATSGLGEEDEDNDEPSEFARSSSQKQLAADVESCVRLTAEGAAVWRTEDDSDVEDEPQLKVKMASEPAAVRPAPPPSHQVDPIVDSSIRQGQRLLGSRSSFQSRGPATQSTAESPSGWSLHPHYAGTSLKSALSNSFDLRPATALPPSASSSRSHMHDMDADLITKQVDLGSLPTSLFAATSVATDRSADRFTAVPAGSIPDKLITSSNSSSTASTPSTPPAALSPAHTQHAAMLSTSPIPRNMQAAPPPPPPWASTSSSTSQAAAGKDSSILNPSWATKAETSRLDDVSDTGPTLGEEEEDLAGGCRTGRRQVQSARPPGVYDQEIDPSIWNPQMERPPSRQKPPPEALHLFSPGHDMPARSSGAARPQTAFVTRSSKPFSGPSVNVNIDLIPKDLLTRQRPPSRQKPPPMSVDLGQGQFPEQPGSQGSSMDCYRHIFTSDDSDEETM